MEEKLSLEEKTLGYLLKFSYPFQDFDPTYDYLLDKPDHDSRLIKKLNEEELGFCDSAIEDLRKRNPVLYMNCYFAAKKVVDRARETKDISSALASVISDPYGLGTGKYYISMGGPHSPLSFIFYHELGKQLNIQDEVDEELERYIRAHREFMESAIEGMTNSGKDMIWKDLEAFETFADPDYVAKFVRPYFCLLDGDQKVIAVLSSTTTKALERYLQKYTSSPKNR